MKRTLWTVAAVLVLFSVAANAQSKTATYITDEQVKAVNATPGTDRPLSWEPCRGERRAVRSQLSAEAVRGVRRSIRPSQRNSRGNSSRSTSGAHRNLIE